MTAGHRPRRLAICASHPIQYYSPLFRELARRVELRVFYAHCPSAKDQSAVGFGVEFQWDVDLMSGYQSEFLENVARDVSLEKFSGLNTPSVHDSLKRLNPDAVMLLGWHFRSYIQAITAARRLRIPLLVRGDSQLETPRSWVRRAFKALAYPLALLIFNAALYVGERSKRYWEHYHYPLSRLFFSPHCIDNAWFRQRGTSEAAARFREAQALRETEKIILFVGKLTDKKRPLDLVEAVAVARDRHPSLVVCFAGAGPLSDVVEGRAGELGVPIRMCGFCNQTELPAIYAASTMLVLPSDGGETWGLVANEALACGIPVVLSNACGSAPDLVADGKAGHQFPVGDVAALGDRIEHVLASRPSAEAIRRRSDSYSISAAADGIMQAVDAVVDRA